jgi:hypothetical protein
MLLPEKSLEERVYKIVYKISHTGLGPLMHTIFINLNVAELSLQTDGLIGRIKSGEITSLTPEHSVAAT